MLIFYSFHELSQFQIHNPITNLGFVPTMGALHKGHLSLIEASKNENEFTICSIFVNPTQFDNPNDLLKYPRNVNEDIEKLAEIGCDFVYIPATNDLYPNGLQTDNIDLNGLDNEMEGVFRKGHFAGVATVVKRLFLQVKPRNAYFGEKDFQQLQIIKQMVKAENVDVNVIGMPIIREKNGLAMSSRNLRLTAIERNEASIIFKNLCFAKDNFTQLSFDEIIEKIKVNFKNSSLKLEYFIIANEDTLKPENHHQKDKNYRAFISAFCGEVRLIDTMKMI